MKKYFEDLIAKHQELEDHIFTIAATISKINGGRLEPHDFDRFYFEGKLIIAEFGDYCCGHYERDDITFPKEYLWDPDWEKTYRAEKLRKNIEALREKEKKEAEEKRRKEFNEREMYLKLKEKYDGNC